MNKKIIIGIVAIIVIAFAGSIGYLLLNNNDNTNETEKNSPTNENNVVNNDNQNNETGEDNLPITSNGKTLIVYYSASGSTKRVAEQIAKNLDADLFEITPVDIYTSNDLDWTNENSRVSREHNDESLRDVKLTTTKVNNWESYDTVLIGYPIWWGIAAWPVNSFVSSNDFTGKTVIPFCTSASSGLGQSGELLESIAAGGNWQEGHRFNSSASDSDIKNWIDSLR